MTHLLLGTERLGYRLACPAKGPGVYAAQTGSPVTCPTCLDVARKLTGIPTLPPEGAAGARLCSLRCTVKCCCCGPWRALRPLSAPADRDSPLREQHGR